MLNATKSTLVNVLLHAMPQKHTFRIKHKILVQRNSKEVNVRNK